MQMGNELRTRIAEIYDGGAWETVVAKQFCNDQPWEVWKFEQDVEYEGKLWRCVILSRIMFDAQSIEDVDYAEDLLAEAWPL